MFDAFHFLRPHMLWALIPLVVVCLFRHRMMPKHGVWVRVCDPELLGYLLTPSQRKADRAPWIAFGLGLFFSIIALGGPTWSKKTVDLYTTPQSRLVIVSLAPSMMAEDLSPSRLVRERLKVEEILKQSQGMQVGVMVYSEDAYIVSPLTTDARTISHLVPVLGPDLMPASGNQPEQALKRALPLIKQGGDPAHAHVILMTDVANDKMLAPIKALNSAGVRVTLVGVGTSTGAPIPDGKGGFISDKAGNALRAGLAEQPLRQVARKSGARYITMTRNHDDLKQILSVDKHTGDAVKQKADVWKDQGPWFILLALLCASTAFRRGLLQLTVLAFLPGAISMPLDAQAFSLIRNQAQQAQYLFEQGEYTEAAGQFKDPMWQGSAYYRAGDFEQAKVAFEAVDTPDGHYNLGNTLAKMQQFDEAIAAYDEVLARDPDHEDAQANKELLERLKDQPPPQDQDPQKQADQNSPPKEQDQQAPPKNDENHPDQGENKEDAQPPQDDRQDTQNQEDEQGSEKDADKEPEPEQNPEETDNEPSPASVEGAPQDDDQRASDALLRQIPDDPGGLLRTQFRMQHRARHIGERK